MLAVEVMLFGEKLDGGVLESRGEGKVQVPRGGVTAESRWQQQCDINMNKIKIMHASIFYHTRVLEYIFSQFLEAEVMQHPLAARCLHVVHRAPPRP